MSIPRPIGVAIAGFGLGYKTHLPALKTCGSMKLVAFWHPCYKHLNSVTQVLELSVYTEFKLLLNNLKIEAVIIATHSKVYFTLAKAALNANKHVFLDRPHYLTSTEIKKLQELALEKQLKIAVNFIYRSIPLFQQLAHLIHNGVLGRPQFVKVDWLLGIHRKNYQQSDLSYNLSPDESTIDYMGIHVFDLLHWLMGPIFLLSALNTTVTLKDQICTDYDFTKSANIVLLQGKLQFAPDYTVPIQINLSSILSHGKGFWIEFYGTQSALIIGNENQNDFINDFGLWMAPLGQPLRRLPIDQSLSFELRGGSYKVAVTSRLQTWWATSIRDNQPITPGLIEAYWGKVVCELAKIHYRDFYIVNNGIS
ncbi:putative oxidoreductase (chromatophore) [Paulinella micropora]|uniref:Oxidoreductase n=1 Tax=Paulinella micropora TaxID=1928728 RepID=A0A1L5YAZ7_9EUKA|nr:putative oxidoreductase [Paulinella micropora]AQX44643.1 putative oxidoreductase [Paulinella micropora]BBL85850.1 putative oxidoreductase [Paulinella micropora]